MLQLHLRRLVAIGALLSILAATVGCDPVEPKPSATRPTLTGSLSEATETIGPGAPPVVRRFSSGQDVDWYVIASTSSAAPSLETTVLVSMKVISLDSDYNEIGTSEYTVSGDGWQTGSEELDPQTRYLAVSPLDETTGAYALQIR